MRQLSRGGFGDTYLAEDTHRFQELCVVREFNPQVRGKLAVDKAQTLFEREASILYQLDHPQIPKFRELLREGDRLFLVQDYIEGPTYRDLLARRQAQGSHFSEAEVTQLLTQLLPLLQYLHGLGLVHRDISPDNLLQRNADGRPVLIDFGGVKQLLVNVRYQLGVPEPYQSATGEVTRLGQVGYAPESQRLSGQASPTDDLYALGVTAMVLLTGQEPTDLYDQRQKRWVWPDHIEASPRLRELLERLAAPEPAQRYGSAGQVLAALNLVSPYAETPAWDQTMPVRMQPITPPPPEPPPMPRTVAATHRPPPPTAYQPTAYSTATAKGQLSLNQPHPPLPYATAHRSPRRKRPSPAALAALAGLMVILGAATGLWWWLDPLDWRTEAGSVSPGGSDAENPAFSEAEQARKQSIRERTLALGVDRAYLISLTDQLFFEQNPDLQGTQLTDRPEDAERRAKWDAIALETLDLLEANLSTEARSRLGRYNPTDRDRWQRQVNDLYVSSNALYDLTNARFNHLFPGRPQEGFVETPVDQIWYALAQDRVNALVSGAALTEIQFAPNTFSQQQSKELPPGDGHVYILNLSQGQLMRLNLDAPPSDTRLSLYLPVPTPDNPHLLASADQTTWAGELPQSGYYEVVVVSQSETTLPYTLTAAVDNVIDDIINRPPPPDKRN